MHSKHIQPSAKTIRVTWVRSAIGYSEDQKATVKALGLRRLGDTVEKTNNAAVRGMIDKIGHLVAVEAIE